MPAVAAAVIPPILTALVQAFPGYLALITGKQNDEEALEHCKSKIDAIKWHPAASAIDS